MPTEIVTVLGRKVEVDSSPSTTLKEKIDALITEISSKQWEIGKGFVQLGNALIEVRATKAWSDWGFSSFGAYIDSIKDRVEKGRTQLYGTISISERLLPYVSKEAIETMGISKAGVLARTIKDTGKIPSSTTMALALNPKVRVEELKAQVFEETNIRPLNEKGTYFDLGGFYVTPEEKEEIERCFSVAERTDPVIPQDWSEWARRKEIFMRLVKEYIGTYSHEVEGL